MKRDKQLTGILAAVLSIHLLCSNTGVVLANENIPKTTNLAAAESTVETKEQNADTVIQNNLDGIPDENLYEAILKTADKDKDGILTVSEAGAITFLSATNKNIENLKGLEYCTALKELFLSGNSISDITPLANLTSLQQLDLNNNQISDITALKNLTSLQSLSLYENTIRDISPLANLSSLKQLQLHYNQISDIAPLANLSSLKWLDLHNNQISDITPLTNLTSLQDILDLQNNQISDIRPLMNLTSISELYLHNNNISDVTPFADANFNSLFILNLSHNQIRDISALKPFIEKYVNVFTYDNPIAVFIPSEFAAALEEEDIVIKANEFVTITFKQGSALNPTENTSYDFTATVTDSFLDANLSTNLKEIFIKKISYNYSGKLPAAAEIELFVGKDHIGKEVYYMLLNDDGTVNTAESDMEAKLVNENGYITVTQTHCSSYIITTEKVTQESTNTNKPGASNGGTTNNGQNNSNNGTANNGQNNSNNGAANNGQNNSNNGAANNGQNNSNNNNTSTTSPTTGETSSLGVWAALSSFGILALVLLYLKKQKSR